MRTALFLFTVPALIAQAPDPATTLVPPEIKAVEKDMEPFLKPYLEMVVKAMKEGKAPAGSFDPAPGVAHFRKRIQETSGDIQHACRIAECTLHLLGRTKEAKEVVLALIRTVPADSPAWAIGTTVLQLMPRLGGAEAVAYFSTIEQKGIPVARRTVLSVAGNAAVMAGKAEEAKAALAKLEKDFPEATQTKRLAESIEKLKQVAVGVKAPEFSIDDLEAPGQKLGLATFKGKWLLLDFWGTWCTWCIKELPTTHKLYATYKEKGLEILSLASDEKPELVQAFRKKPAYPMPWRHGFLGKGNPPHPMQTAYNIQSFPSLFLINPAGQIVAKGGDLREANLEKTLQKFLK